jgi:2-keto-4-pentenoate hydratase/2-oxohepta-3-ene-1,7-dioic acid hydratase in catechol pathway
MKIICIGRNYAEHAKEFGNKVPDQPIFFFKPDTSLITRNRPFFYPDFSNDIQYETEIVLKISRLGKNIEERFAHRYYKELTIGIDLTARDRQKECKEKGRPWEIAKGFDGSAPLGKFVKKDAYPDIYNLNFSLKQNDELVQKGNTRDLIFNFEQLIAYVSQFITLKIGDLIFTGTPVGVGPVNINDRLTGYLEDQPLIDFRIK